MTAKANLTLRSGLVALVLCLAGLALATSATNAQAPKIAARWQGSYSYSDPSDVAVPFTMTLTVSGNALSGHLTEPATFGDGTSPFLYANLKGSISGNQITYTKTYDGTGGQTHSVNYVGTLSVDGSMISGSWHVGEGSGTFLAMATAP